MPTYSFKCKAPDCNDKIVDIFLPMDQYDEPQHCPECGDEMIRILNMVSILGMDEYGRSTRSNGKG